MNLLLINYEYPPLGGGAGNATMFLARALEELGHHAVVLTAAGPLNPHGRTVDGGVTVHRLAVRRRAADRASMGEMLSFVLAALRLAPGIAAEHAIDGVIVFFTLPCGPVALRLRQKLGLPYVVSLRGGDVPGLAAEITWLHWLLTPVRRGVLRSALAVVANDAGLARQSESVDPVAVQVIPNGVDCEAFVPRPTPGTSDGPTKVLYVGRFHRQKNLLFLLEQMARLRATAPDGWRLVLVGDGEERSSIEHCLRVLNLEGITTMHGWLDDKDRLREIYQQADVVVNPSLYEGMPNVVLEAMACGLPVVASQVPGNDTLVRTGESGYLFKLGDGDGLCRALQEIRARPELAHTLGREGRRRVEAGFSWEQAARAYTALFKPAP